MGTSGRFPTLRWAPRTSALARLREFGAVNSGRWLSRAVRAQRRCRPGLRYLCQQCIRQRPLVPATVARANDRLAALSVNSPAGDERQQPLQSGHRHRNFDWRQRVVQRRPALSSSRLGTPLRAGTGHPTGRLAIVTCRWQPRIEHQDSATSSHSRASAMPPTDLVAARCAAASPALRTRVEP